MFDYGTVHDILAAQDKYSHPWSWPRQCFCRGGPDCCVTVAERRHEAAIRANERAKMRAELEGKSA